MERRKFANFKIFLTTLFLTVITGGQLASAQNVTIRAAHFPNITHAQAVIGHANGAFQKALGNSATVDWKIFNAGPAVAEAMLANQLDIAYIGPNPAVTAYVRSHGAAVRIVAGAMSGGAALIVRADAGINKPQDFHGKRVATPQLGNTQDVALRAWLQTNGMKPSEKGGDVQVIPVANADQLTLMSRKQLDAAWAPEPWASRLIREANGKLFLDERTLWPKGQFVTTVVVVRTEFLKQHPDLVRTWLRTHLELTDWINKNLTEAKKTLNQELEKETTKALPQPLLDEAFSRLEVTADPLRASLLKSAQAAFDAGFLGREKPELSGLFDLSLLESLQKAAPPAKAKK